jgi:hypothetical protein
MSDLIIEIVTEGISSERLQWMLVLLGGALVAFLKFRGKRWLDPILFGFVTSALLALLFFACAVKAQLMVLPPTMNVGNVEQLLFQWIKAYGYSIERLEADDMHFAFEIRPNGVAVEGIQFVIGRAKNRARFVSVAAAHRLYPHPADIAPLEALSHDKAQALLSELRFEIDQRHLDHDGFFVSTHVFRIYRDLPITAELSEDRLVTSVHEVERAMSVILARLRETLYYTPEIPSPEVEERFRDMLRNGQSHD